MGSKAALLKVIPPVMFKNKVVVFQCSNDMKTFPSIVDKFKHDGWELSYEEPYENNMIAFVCRQCIKPTNNIQ